MLLYVKHQVSLLCIIKYKDHDSSLRKVFVSQLVPAIYMLLSLK